MKRQSSLLAVMSLSLFASACASIPKGAVAVDRFEKERYLGKWYEIARLDFRFERNLSDTTAEYSVNPSGTIAVRNRGYNYVTKKWQEARGTARFRSADTKGELEVSFFGPFYGGYNVIALDEHYTCALVAGSSLKYLWILSRTPTIPDDLRDRYLTLARSLGYDVDALVWVRHGTEPER